MNYEITKMEDKTMTTRELEAERWAIDTSFL